MPKHLLRIGLAVSAAAIVAVSPAAALNQPAGPSGDGPRHDTVTGVEHDVAVSARERDAFRASRTTTDAPRTAAAGIHPAQGVRFLASSGAKGSMAVHSVDPNLTITNSGTTIYTPTMYPPGGSCIEMVTRYTTGGRWVSAWDWCNGITFRAQVAINSTFLSKYTDGANHYSVMVYPTDGKWIAYLYNYQTSAWEQFYTSSGTTQAGNNGWDIYELYSDVNASTGRSYACGDLANRSFTSSGIKIRVNNSWVDATSSNSDNGFDASASSFKCPTHSYTLVAPYTQWKATG